MSIRVYRVTVTRWPTDDGQPWPRFISAQPDDPSGAPCVEDLPWLTERVKPDSDAERKFGRFADYFGGTSECYGYVLPKTTRRHYFSRAAAEAWAADARLLGAEVTVEASEPVTWREADR